jgi:hypothetical protein
VSKATSPGALEERRKLFELLDRLAAVERRATPKHMPHDAIAEQWMYGNADTRRKIEEEIDRLPKKSN